MQRSWRFGLAVVVLAFAVVGVMGMGFEDDESEGAPELEAMDQMVWRLCLCCVWVQRTAAVDAIMWC